MWQRNYHFLSGFLLNFHHGLVMLLHLFSHLTGARIGIRHLCDWALFLNSIEEKEFLKLFQEPIVVLHIEKDVFNAYMTVECLAKDFWATWARNSNMRAKIYKST